MKTKHLIHLTGLALAILTLNPQLSTVFAQGSLTPPGAPAPTMKTLAQIEARTPISSAPFTISVPGSYYLITNLTVRSGDAIAIATNGVTLDLNGFTLSSTANPAAGYGVRINTGLRNLAVLNGFIRGGVTNNAGTYGGPGFEYGISYPSGAPLNTRVVGVTVSGCQYYGIFLGIGHSTVVESCTVRTVGSFGIIATTIKNSTASDCGWTAINGSQVSDCRGQSSSQTAISAFTAQNCYGESGSGTGLFATYTALNCYGQSSSDIGLSATTAQNCYGESSSGTGLYATTATGCSGYSSSGPRGLYARSANTCVGYRFGGRAIEATVANGCYAIAGTNLITYKYNMP